MLTHVSVALVKEKLPAPNAPALTRLAGTEPAASTPSGPISHCVEIDTGPAPVDCATCHWSAPVFEMRSAEPRMDACVLTKLVPSCAIQKPICVYPEDAVKNARRWPKRMFVALLADGISTMPVNAGLTNVPVMYCASTLP